MDIEKIRYFIEIANNGNISKTAQSLFVTQQSLSKTLKKMEEDLSCRLFDRNPHGVTLTAEGHYLYTQYAPLLDYYDNINSEVNEHFKIVKGKIITCTAPGVLRSLGPQVILQFLAQYPEIELENHEMSDLKCEEMVLNGTYKIGLTKNPKHLDSLTFLPVKSEKVFLIVNKRNKLAKLDRVSISDLREEDFVSFPEESRSRDLICEECAKHGFKPNIIFESSDVYPLTEVVSKNLAIMISVEHVVNSFSHMDICSIPLEDESINWEIGFIYKKTEKLEYIYKKFIKYIVDSNYDTLQGK